MGRLITQEQGIKEDDGNAEYAIRKISTSAKTEAIISIEVVEKKKLYAKLLFCKFLLCV